MKEDLWLEGGTWREWMLPGSLRGELPALSRIFSVDSCLVCCFCSQTFAECYQRGQDSTLTNWVRLYDSEFVYHVGHHKVFCCLLLYLNAFLSNFGSFSGAHQLVTFPDTQTPAFPLPSTWGEVSGLLEGKATDRITANRDVGCPTSKTYTVAPGKPEFKSP